jgi:DNA-binding NarL/FixJ family response regulator
MSVKVTVFEDRRQVREAMCLLIEGTSGLELSGAWPDCQNLIGNLKRNLPDVVLMDIEMPGMNGIEAVRIIKEEFPLVVVVMQTVFEDEDKIFDAICNGASGYLLKDTPPAKLMDSIVEAYHGGSPMSPAIARKTLKLFQQFMTPVGNSSKEDYHLTTREKEVLQCLVKGFSYKMIASECVISFDTVRTHIRNIYQKLHVASMSEAVAKAIKERLV